MKLSLARQTLKTFGVMGIALFALGAIPTFAQDSFSNPNTNSNYSPCWRTNQDYQHYQHWMGHHGPMMSQGGYGRGGGGYGGIYDPKTVETITGEVISVDSFSSNRGMSQGIHLQVKTGNETLDIHLGPSWYLQNQDLKIQPQDTITVTGSRVNSFGQPSIIAGQVTKDNQTVKLRDDNGIPLWTRGRQN